MYKIHNKYTVGEIVAKRKRKHIPQIFSTGIFLLDVCPIFAKIIIEMETTKKSTGLYWILFFASVVAAVVVYKVGGGYCSMVLPFNVTFFAKALDLM